jgi:hypothetical protein
MANDCFFKACFMVGFISVDLISVGPISVDHEGRPNQCQFISFARKGSTARVRPQRFDRKGSTARVERKSIDLAEYPFEPMGMLLKDIE